MSATRAASSGRKTAQRGVPGKGTGDGRRRPRWWVRMFVWLAVILAFCGLLGVAGVALLFVEFGRGLPDIRSAQDYQPRQTTWVYARDGQVIARLVGDDLVYRTVLPFDEIPEVMRDAVLAAEDADFYSHPGIDLRGLARAMLTNVMRGRMSQGASTITQQVVKNLILTPERTIRRKVQEVLLAYRLEQNLTKDEILALYLNEVFFGSRYYGVEEASLYYFGHGASALSLEEAALLAGIVQSPNRYNPYRHPEEALGRRSYVLRQMRDKGLIEQSQYVAALESPLRLAGPGSAFPLVDAFPWYTDAVRRELLETLPAVAVLGGGLRVETGLDTVLQEAADEAVRSGLREFDARHGFHRPYATVGTDPEAVSRWARENEPDAGELRAGEEYRALVVESGDAETLLSVGSVRVRLDREPESRMRPDERTWGEAIPVGAVFTVTPCGPPAHGEGSGGEALPMVCFLSGPEGALVAIDLATREVRALVGGYDAGRTSFNRAIQAERQVGSTFKPLVYGAALEARVATPATIYADQPITFPIPGQPDWQPRNWDGEYEGFMSMRIALARSRNVVAVRVLDQVGIDRVHDFARRAGIEAELTPNLTLALGSSEMTPFELTSGFATLATGGTRSAPVLVARVMNARGEILYEAERGGEQAIREDVAWLTRSLMESVVTEGTGASARRLGHPLAGKTGTTNGTRDAWFVGFSSDLIAGVWVGRDNNESLGRGESGGHTALPIWVRFMERALEGREPVPFPPAPAGVVTATIDEATGLLARPGAEGARTEYFLAGTAPRELSPVGEERTAPDTLLRGGGDGSGSGETTVEDGF